MDTLATKEGGMTLLYPSFLWLLIPLLFLLFKGIKDIIFKVHILVLILLILALARPVIKESLQEASIYAKDIVIALDVSYSMRASDLNPTRYHFAKETIKALLDKNPSDNIMLIAFTSNPLLLSPPTSDHALIKIALQSLNPEFILTRGTSLKKLFSKLADISSGHKNLILITDGGEEEDVEALTDLLQHTDISLITLATGSTSGTTINKRDGSLLKDKEGNLVVSRINPLLETLTTRVHGIYLTASSHPKATANTLNDALHSQIRSSQQVQKMQHHYLELYQIPLLLATLLFLLLHTRGVKYLIILFALFGSISQASIFDDYHLQQAYKAYKTNDFNTSTRHLKKIKEPSLQSQMTLANAYYKTQAFKKSIHTYKSIRSSSVKVKQQLYYNIANAYSHLESYTKAKVYYTKALQLGFDKDAAYNLRLVTLLKNKVDATLGIAHPKSQSGDSSKSESQDKNKKTREEDQPSSGSGSGGESKAKEDKKKNKLLNDQTSQKQPLGSKVYELINKGYIHEKQPW